jgi:hypothetical protein
MNLRATLFGIFSLWLVALGIWIIILFNTDPDTADKLTYIAFVASLFLWISSLHTLIEYYLRIRANHREQIYTPLPIASRHGIMLGLIPSLLLGLKFLHILNLPDAILIIITICVCELYFKGKQNVKPAKSTT